MSMVSRRNFLKSVGISALGLGVGARLVAPQFRVLAQEGGAPTLSALTRFALGDLEVTVIQDGTTTFDPTIMGINADLADLTALLEANNLPTDQIRSTFNTTLVKAGDQLALLDTGLGAAQGGGRLLPTLNALGLTPEDITSVIFTHFHPDHIGGGVTNGALTFPNAVYHFPQAEWDFVQSVPSGSPIDGLVQATTGMLDLAMTAEQVNFYAAEAEIIPGISAVSAPGHTPGHTALLISSGDAQLLDMADAALQSVISLQRPDYYAQFDADGAAASATRVALLDRAATDGLQVLGYHFPFPGVGYVVKDGAGFRFVPMI